MKLFKKLKRGVKAMANELRSNNSDLLTMIDNKISSFKASDKYRNAVNGRKYYVTENDILKHVNYTLDENGRKVKDESQANNKLAHAHYKNMVDEKVSYALSKEYTLSCDDEAYLRLLQDTLGKSFPYKLMKLGYEASNTGIGWLHPYIDEKGSFRTMIVPYERFVPIWKDNGHEELSAGIYFYTEVYREGSKERERKHAEYWTAEGVQCFIKDDKVWLSDYKNNFDEAGNAVSHYQGKEGWCSWGKVPFIPFKNNFIEAPDIKFVKSLIDGYDSSRSEAANYIDDVRNLLYVIKGYTSNDKDKLRNEIRSRLLVLDNDDDEESGASVLSPSTDLTAVIAHSEQLKRDIIEAGQGVLKDFDKFGNNPSGIALSFMYSSLDLKAGAMCTHFTFAFDELMHFVNSFLDISKAPEIKITFNMNMKINETENLDNCQRAKNLGVSTDTWLSKCAWVDDIQKELDFIGENEVFQDKVDIEDAENKEE